jgi:hypothetical protein
MGHFQNVILSFKIKCFFFPFSHPFYNSSPSSSSIIITMLAQSITYHITAHSFRIVYGFGIYPQHLEMRSIAMAACVVMGGDYVRRVCGCHRLVKSSSIPNPMSQTSLFHHERHDSNNGDGFDPNVK